MRSPIRGRFLAVAAVCLSLLAGCSDDEPRYVDLATANYTSPGELAARSFHLARGWVVGRADRAVISRELGLVYLVNKVTIVEVLARRPESSSRLAAGETVRVGVAVLDPRERPNIINFDEIAERYPTADEALMESEEVLLFLRYEGSSVSSGRDPDFTAVGHAAIGPGGSLRWKGFPGDLAGTMSDLATTLAEVIPLFGRALSVRNAPTDPTPVPTEAPGERPAAGEPG